MSGDCYLSLVEVLVPLSLPMLDDERAPWGEGLSEDGLRPMGGSSADVLGQKDL